jgi:hypothetical protein
MLQRFPLPFMRQKKQSEEKPLKKARSSSLPPVRHLAGQLFLSELLTIVKLTHQTCPVKEICAQKTGFSSFYGQVS